MHNSSYLYSSFIAELYFKWIIWWSKSGFWLSFQEKVCRKNEFIFVSVRFLRTCPRERHSWTSVWQCPTLEALQDCAGIPKSAGWNKLPFIAGLVLAARTAFVLQILLKQMLASVLVLHLCMLFLIVSPALRWPVQSGSLKMVTRSSLGSTGQFWERMKWVSNPCPLRHCM